MINFTKTDEGLDPRFKRKKFIEQKDHDSSMACPKCGSHNVIGLEYSYDMKEHYDGISEWTCGDCKYREGRWTGKELKDNEVEKRFGGK